MKFSYCFSAGSRPSLKEGFLFSAVLPPSAATENMRVCAGPWHSFASWPPCLILYFFGWLFYGWFFPPSTQRWDISRSMHKKFLLQPENEWDLLKMSPTKNLGQIQKPKFKCTFIPTQRLIMEIPISSNIVTQPFHNWNEDCELKTKQKWTEINKLKKKNPCYETWRVRQVRQVLAPHSNNFLAPPWRGIWSLRDYFPNNPALIEW